MIDIIKNTYNITDNLTSFISMYNNSFHDDIKIRIDYFGDSADSYDINVGNETEHFSFLGNDIIRKGVISYCDGAYMHTDGYNSSSNFIFDYNHLANGTLTFDYGDFYGHYVDSGYDGLMSFTFANSKVNSTVLRYWLNQKNRTNSDGNLVFSEGPMKACYGSFLEGLLVIYCSDLVADIASEKFNVSWERTSPMVMSVRDDIDYTILSGECSFYFGRTVYGCPDNIKSFYFACSSSFSLIEYYVSQVYFPGGSLNDSVTTGLGFILNNEGSLEFIQDGNFTLIREVDSIEKILIYDANTGLFSDCIHINITGSYCYSNQQSDWGVDFGNVLSNLEESIKNCVLYNVVLDDVNNEVLGIAGSMAISIGVAALLASNPAGWAVGACLIIGGIYTTYYADDLNQGWNYQRGLSFAIDVGLSAIPGAGFDLAIGKATIKRAGSTISKNIITKSSNSFSKFLVEKAGTKGMVYGGSVSGDVVEYVKYGTFESAFVSRYSENLYGTLVKMGDGYFRGKYVQFLLNYYFDDFNLFNTFMDTFDTDFNLNYFK